MDILDNNDGRILGKTAWIPTHKRWRSRKHGPRDAARLSHVCGLVGAMASVNDFAIRTPRALTREDTLNTGKRRFRFLPTPQIPQGWDAGVMFEETAQTFFCSDLFHQWGDREPLTTNAIIERCREALLQTESVGQQNRPKTETHEIRSGQTRRPKPNRAVAAASPSSGPTTAMANFSRADFLGTNVPIT